MKHELYHSYLVRFWQEVDGELPGGAWRCEVESIQTNQRRQFASLDSLFGFLQKEAQTTGRLAEDTRRED